MDLKKRISLQWKVFVPTAVCLWIVIIGTLVWQTNRMRTMRDDMIHEQLSLLGTALVDLAEEQDTASFDRMAHFISKYYSQDEHYDPINVWILDMNTDTLVKRYGSTIPSGFKLPKERQGTLTIPVEQLSPDFEEDGKFIYSMHAAPFSDKRIYVILNYTDDMQDILDTRFTYLWVVFIAIGILATIVAYLSSSYYGKSLKQLRNFAMEASSKPNFILNEEVELPDNELGDITKQIFKIHSQRNDASESWKKEEKNAKTAKQETDRLKRELPGYINHELKTPVGVIKGIVDTIVDNPDMDETRRKKFMVDIQKNVKRLTDLINDITTITKLESGERPRTKKINFLEYAKGEFQECLDQSHVLGDKMTFTYELPNDCELDASETLLHTILLNFVKNSVAYSEGSICRLELSKEDDNFYHFIYYDNGIGVSSEHLPHLFERFYRVNAGRSRNLGGTGLGLPLVETLVKNLGGYIKVLNHYPTGLEFNFSLPKYKK